MAHPGGRPTKLTRELLEDFQKYLPTVLYLETVAGYLGVGASTWRAWLARGRKEANRLAHDSKAKPKRSEAIYLEFLETYKKGVAEGEMFAIGVIRGAASKRPAVTTKTRTTAPDGKVTETEQTEFFQPQWTAAAWIAERRFNSRWGSDRQTIKELQHTIKELQAMVEKIVPASAQPEQKGQAAQG